MTSAAKAAVKQASGQPVRLSNFKYMSQFDFHVGISFPFSSFLYAVCAVHSRQGTLLYGIFLAEYIQIVLS